ncbi:hypothetical protein TNCV_4432411 [Trichonephila clavipes]|nr:hypothetical protein TNCV_4432411 [Trichonephila clavipes]
MSSSRHLTMVQKYEIRRQKPSYRCIFIPKQQLSQIDFSISAHKKHSHLPKDASLINSSKTIRKRNCHTNSPADKSSIAFANQVNFLSQVAVWLPRMRSLLSLGKSSLASIPVDVGSNEIRSPEKGNKTVGRAELLSSPVVVFVVLFGEVLLMNLDEG